VCLFLLAGAVFAEATVRSVNFGVSDLSKSLWSGARVYDVDCSKATVSISRDAVKVQFAAFEEPFYWPKFVGADEKEATAVSAGGGSGAVHAPGL
jgi:hypothetical protein